MPRVFKLCIQAAKLLAGRNLENAGALFVELSPYADLEPIIGGTKRNTYQESLVLIRDSKASNRVVHQILSQTRLLSDMAQPRNKILATQNTMVTHTHSRAITTIVLESFSDYVCPRWNWP